MFFSDTCFLTKIIDLVTWSMGQKFSRAHLGISSAPCGSDRGREVVFSGSRARLESPRWVHPGAWHFSRKVKKSGLRWASLLLQMGSNPLCTDAPAIARLLMWQLWAVRTRKKVPRPLRPGPEYWHNVTSTVFYLSNLSLSPPRFKERKQIPSFMDSVKEFSTIFNCSKGLKEKHPELQSEDFFQATDEHYPKGPVAEKSPCK